MIISPEETIFSPDLNPVLMRTFLFCFSAFLITIIGFHPTSSALAPVTTTATDTTDLRAYAGHYTFASNGYFSAATVTVKDGALYGEIDSYGNNKLLPQKDADTFQSTSSYGSVYQFTRDTTKKVTGLKLTLQGNTVEATKDKPKP